MKQVREDEDIIKESEKYSKEHDNKNVHVSDCTIETSEEHTSRRRYENSQLMMGLFLGVLLGLSISILYDAIQQQFQLVLWYKYIIGIVSILLTGWFIKEAFNGKFKFYSKTNN